MTAELDPYAKEARRQYRLMAHSLELDLVVYEDDLRLVATMPFTLIEAHGWITRLRKLAQTEGLGQVAER